MVEFPNSTLKDSEVQTTEGKLTPATGSSTPNGTLKRRATDGEGNKRRRTRKKSRRLSVSKPARDPRDDPSPQRPSEEVIETRTPSPVLDFDGLSRPSKSPTL